MPPNQRSISGHDTAPLHGADFPHSYEPVAPEGEGTIDGLTAAAMEAIGAHAVPVSPESPVSIESSNRHINGQGIVEAAAVPPVSFAAEAKETLGPLYRDLVLIGEGLHDARQKKIDPGYKEPADTKPANVVRMEDYLTPDYDEPTIESRGA